jgi:two-component system sensor histidine kinase UhpB
MTEPKVRWYRRLQVQLWLWAILPVTLVLVAITFTGVRSHEISMHDFVAERDIAMAWLLGRQIDDDLARGLLRPDGENLSSVVGDARIGRRGVIYVLDGAGRVLFHPDPDYLGRDLSADPLIRQVLSSITGTGSGHFADGSTTIASFAMVGSTGWRVVIEEPMADIIVPILRLTSVLPALVVMAGILSLIVILFSVRTIVWPLQRLSEKAMQITGGELGNLEQEVGGVEEIRQLHYALRDMVERIRHYQESMRDYIEGTTRGQETERARLSRELHDETVQALVAIGQRAQLAQRALDRGQAQPAAEGLRQVRTLCQQTLDELRRTIRALRPVYLEELGFLPALEALVEDVREQGLSAEMLVHGDPRRLHPEVEMAAFRLVQEALSNALRHSRAQRVSLLVHLEEHELTLTIEDDGQGFVPPENPQALTGAGHLGLVGMRERVLLLGGRLQVHSRPGQGTRISARLPL